MNKPLVKIIDNQFPHGKSFGSGDLQISPENFDWYRGDDNINDFIVFTENMFHLVDRYNEKIKVGFIIESELINPTIYVYIKNPINYNKFNFIYTFSKNLININPEKFKYYSFGGCWIYPSDRLIYDKTKNISIISSIKKITFGHKLRHKIIENFNNKIDGIYGGGYKFINNKIEGLKDYRYSIVIEQANHNGLFSEKLIDCFVTGTIPIYWGCDSKINEYFNLEGILQFNDINELSLILEKCDENFYNNNLSAIKENFDISKKYVIPEDYLWSEYFKKLI